MTAATTLPVPDPAEDSAGPPTNPGTTNVLKSLRRLMPFIRPALPALVASGVLAALASLAGLGFPLLIRWIVDGPIKNGDPSGLWWPGSVLLVLGILEAVLFNVRRLLSSRPAVRVEQRIRDRLYEKLQSLPVSFHDRWPAGQLITRASSDLSTIRRFVAFGAVFLMVNILTFVVGVVILLSISVPLGLIVAALAIPLVFLTRSYEHRYQVLARRSQDQAGDLTTTVEESVLGIRIIKAFGRSGHLGRQFLDKALDLRSTELTKAKVISLLWAVIIMLPEIALTVVLLLGVHHVADGTMTVGDLLAFFGIAMALRWPIDSIGWLLTEANNAAAATDRCFEVLDTPLEIESSPRPERPSSRSGHLRFAGVGFHFADARPGSTPIFRELDLDVPAGSTMAVVGATGTGKTTLTSLVERLYDVTEGSILLDGVDLRDLDLADLRDRVSIAFEEPILFSASVRENITLGRPKATDAEVREALQIAQADFVDDLPWGLDTRIGEQGMSLSGGQRQRLALARAVVGRPSLLVLDDPLSALDIHTEAQVESALRSVLSTTTSLVIAHRASTVMLADQVALLSGGRITAVGRHSELMANNPEYRHLLSTELDDDLGPHGELRPDVLPPEPGTSAPAATAASRAATVRTAPHQPAPHEDEE